MLLKSAAMLCFKRAFIFAVILTALTFTSGVHRLKINLLQVPAFSMLPPDFGKPSLKTVLASFYGYNDGFHGKLTASGEPFDSLAYTAAHRTLPFGTKVKVYNPQNGKEVIVVINDRGPFAHKREIDLSYGAARELGMVNDGLKKVQLSVLG